MNKRPYLYISLFSSIMVFGLVSLAVLYQFALPRPNLVSLGPVKNFPPSDTPYFVRGEKPVFIVNTDGKFIVLVAVPPHPKACQARWLAEDAKFMEPCLGSQFKLDGTYILGPSPRNMDQYAYTIENGILLLNLDQKILGEKHP